MAGAYVLTSTQWKDLDGNRYRRGDLLDPPASQVERLLRAGAIALASEPEPEEQQVPAGDPPPPADPPSDPPPTGQVKAPNRPKAAATEAVWEKYAAARGVNTAGLSKDQLIAAVDKLDAK